MRKLQMFSRLTTLFIVCATTIPAVAQDTTYSDSAGIHVSYTDDASLLGVSRQPADKMQWMLDDRLGLFIHWGLYAGPAQGEWYMENKGILPDEYRRLAYPGSDSLYFDASGFNAWQWVRLAQDAGMRYMNMVTMHHDGYALFSSSYPNAFTSVQTHGRDFVNEYIEACRKAGLHVGIYKTLINWRYPGYYDIYGNDCKKNRFGYTTDASHRENARMMKEELYCQVRELLSNYGPIDQLFWDGGWIAQQGSDANGAFFWESGKYQSHENLWPVSPEYQMKDPSTGLPLGLMGMVRQLQPDILCNPRSGWPGDYSCEEGGSEVTGPIRQGVVEKCVSLTPGWGYTHLAENPQRIKTLGQITTMCADCMVRNMCLLINVGPDRHGCVPEPVRQRLLQFGQWTRQHAQAIYGTRGGPWQPVDRQYGFTFRDDKLYVWLLGDFGSTTFQLPTLTHSNKVLSAYDLTDAHSIDVMQRGSNITLQGLCHQGGSIKVIELKFKKMIKV